MSLWLSGQPARWHEALVRRRRVSAGPEGRDGAVYEIRWVALICPAPTVLAVSTNKWVARCARNAFKWVVAIDAEAVLAERTIA